MQRIHPRERLACAMELLGGEKVVADIGCDHGRLSCALVQSGRAERCIAVDISQPSLKKAEQLAAQLGVFDRVETRLGDGLAPLTTGEADALAILGMGGTLMVRILEAPNTPLAGANLCVLQPMRAAEDIRRWLYERKYKVIDDRVVLDAGRYYQIFSVAPPADARQALPAGWPVDCFLLGYKAFERCEPNLFRLAERMLQTTERKRKTQKSELLDRQAEQLRQILSFREELS
ncbi:MAG TPA: class I SAM-dependent methyltransferase [Clostridia bacterium]|nr:class I SAM-dependent methyltransferase [Clostridia bacterium]